VRCPVTFSTALFSSIQLSFSQLNISSNSYTVFFMPFRLAFDVGMAVPDAPEVHPFLSLEFCP
jgi:hypothetical protein